MTFPCHEKIGQSGQWEDFIELEMSIMIGYETVLSMNAQLLGDRSIEVRSERECIIP